MIFKAHQFSLPSSTATKLVKLLFEHDLFADDIFAVMAHKHCASQQPTRARVYDEDYLHLLNPQTGCQTLNCEMD